MYSQFKPVYKPFLKVDLILYVGNDVYKPDFDINFSQTVSIISHTFINKNKCKYINAFRNITINYTIYASPNLHAIQI